MTKNENRIAGADLRSYYARFFAQAKSGKEQIVVNSPFREDRHPSFSVNLSTGLWHDFATGEGGDAIAFEMKRSGCSFNQAIETINLTSALPAKFPPSGEKCNHGTKASFLPFQTIRHWNELLFSTEGHDALSYLTSRGLTELTLREYLIGFDPQRKVVVVPLAFKEDKAYAVKYFHTDGCGWKLSHGKKVVSTRGRAVLFCAERVADAQEVIIAEGELDCLVLRQNKFNAVSGTAGAGSWKDGWDNPLIGKDVVLVYDADNAGRKGADQLARHLSGIAKSIKDVRLFPNAVDPAKKDVTDFFLAGGSAERLRQLIDDTRTNASELLIENTDSVEQHRPSQLQVANRVCEENIIFSFASGFYFYKQGVWRRDTTKRVEAEVLRIVGHRANRGYIESIRYLVALQCQLNADQLNAHSSLLNFRNGMFDLESGELLPHDPKYYSTIQLAIDYDASATCARWSKFLFEVFDGDESLEDLLQELFGYALIPTTEHQKMFWLIGEGANGKSVVLHVLEALLDKRNVTSIDMKHLSSPFVRAALHNKLASIQSDFPAKFFRLEFWLKSIVSGDSIDAQEKFGPQFEFMPFARLIFAMNSLPQTEDKSHGFFRRVVIIPFKRVFEEHEQDKHLAEKLRTELPGIFLWAYQGLQRLRKEGRFTESALASEALSNYKSQENNVGVFVETMCVVTSEARISAADFWNEYQVFCAESGLGPVERTEFARTIHKNYPVTVKAQRIGPDKQPVRTYVGIGRRYEFGQK